jgi:hypothetical protein
VSAIEPGIVGTELQSHLTDQGALQQVTIMPTGQPSWRPHGSAGSSGRRTEVERDHENASASRLGYAHL